MVLTRLEVSLLMQCRGWNGGNGVISGCVQPSIDKLRWFLGILAARACKVRLSVWVCSPLVIHSCQQTGNFEPCNRGPTIAFVTGRADLGGLDALHRPHYLQHKA